MACEHKRLKSVNCVIMCADCGAVVTQRCSRTGRVKETTSPVQQSEAPSPKGKGNGDGVEEPTVSASGRKIGFEAEPKKRGRKKKEA